MVETCWRQTNETTTAIRTHGATRELHKYYYEVADTTGGDYIVDIVNFHGERIVYKAVDRIFDENSDVWPSPSTGYSHCGPI